MATRTVTRVVRSMPTSDGAGVRLFRALGTPEIPDLDPFLMLDEFRSDDPDDYLAGFPNHPHRGFETVTHMLAGRMEHGDSLGIVHSEFPRIEQGLMWGFQLWVNLPSRDKMCPPRYQDIPAARIPELAIEGGTVRVLAGTFRETTGPVEGIATRPTMLDARLDAGASVLLPAPAGQNAFAYAFEGEPVVGGRPVPRGHLAVLGPGEDVRVDGPGRVLLLAGTPLREPVARHGPFVMNTRDQLVQAFEDYRAGRLGR